MALPLSLQVLALQLQSRLPLGSNLAALLLEAGLALRHQLHQHRLSGHQASRCRHRQVCGR